jgi:hypothetical protein
MGFNASGFLSGQWSSPCKSFNGKDFIMFNLIVYMMSHYLKFQND